MGISKKKLMGKKVKQNPPSNLGGGKSNPFQWLFLVPLKGGRDYITPQKAIYKWYILPIGGLYATYHLLGEPETTVDHSESRKKKTWV